MTLVISQAALAKDIPMKLRMFVGATQVKPTDMNDELKANGLKTIDKVLNAGIEATYPLASFLDVGLRFTKIYARASEVNSTNPLIDYSAQLDQDAVSLIARVPFIKTPILTVDVFGGFGGANTRLNIKTATQDGELKRVGAFEWVASPFATYGGSVALGFKKFFIVAEGGMQMNKVDGFERSGTVNDNINEIDLGGGYVTIGVMFTGMTPKSK